MISSTIKAEIFKSIPKIVTVGVDDLTIKAEYADRMTKIPAESDYPLITLSYFADTMDANSSPLNQRIASEIVANGADEDQRDTNGKRKRITLSMHCQAVTESGHHRNDIISQMITDLETWTMKTLSGVLDDYNVVVIDEMVIPRLDFETGQSVAHGVYDIVLLYPFTYSVDYANIETIDYDTVTA